jgi:hypothetical protein
MSENEQQQELIPISIMNNKRRHLSHTPIPSTGLILKKLPEGYVTVSSIKKRRAASEQISLHDR